MLKSPHINRRAALLGAAALPLAAASLARPARAAAHQQGMGLGFAPYRSFQMGEMQVTTLLAATRPVPNPQSIFGLNASPEDFAAASAEAFIPADNVQMFFTPTLVKHGENTILFDTGLAPAGITEALAAAGHAPEDVTHVVITHMHGDHIGGLIEGDTETFANAAYITGATEFDAWDMSGDETFEAKVRPLSEAGKVTLIDDGATVAPGITAIAAHGHTEGHMAYMLDSGGKQLMLIADAANHYVWSLAHPDWEMRFDRDKEMAAQTRRKLFGQIAADRIPFIGYHMPFPALGYVEARGEGFHYVPASYQQML